MNRLCEMLRPSSNQERAPDDSGPTWHRVLLLREERTSENSPLFLPDFLEPPEEEW